MATHSAGQDNGHITEHGHITVQQGVIHHVLGHVGMPIRRPEGHVGMCFFRKHKENGQGFGGHITVLRLYGHLRCFYNVEFGGVRREQTKWPYNRTWPYKRTKGWPYNRNLV